MQNTDGKVKNNLNHNSSGHLIKTGYGILIGNKNNQKVILVRRESNKNPSNVPFNIAEKGQCPSNFSTSPAGGRFSRNVPGFNAYRTPPKVVDRGLGAAANSGVGDPPVSAGNNGGAADQCPIPSKE